MPKSTADECFAGFSIHCCHRAVLEQVLATVRTLKASAGRGKDTTAYKNKYSYEVISDFIYLEPSTPMSTNAFACWLKRQTFYNEDFTICRHRGKATAVDGLTETMKPISTDSRCWQFAPAPAEAGEANVGVPHDGQVTPDRTCDTTVAAVVHPYSSYTSGVLTAPTADEYRVFFPSMYLTPLVMRHPSVLVERGQPYSLGRALGSFDGCCWFEGHTTRMKGKHRTNVPVDIKVLANDFGETGAARMVREVFVLEQCRDRCPHVIRILDMFVVESGTDFIIHLVFESWGIRLHEYRAQRGYGREVAQPAHHIQRVVKHIGKSLDYIHTELGLIHAGVSLENIVTRETPHSLSRGIECRLGGCSSLEEASSSLFWAGNLLLCRRGAEADSGVFGPTGPAIISCRRGRAD